MSKRSSPCVGKVAAQASEQERLEVLAYANAQMRKMRAFLPGAVPGGA